MSADTSIAMLRAAFPSGDFPEATVRVYTRALADVDPDMLDAAVMRLLRRARFLPKIAEIREEVAREALSLPTPEEAWALVHNPGVPVMTMPGPVREALDYVGGRFTLKQTTELATVRAQFRKAYESAVARATELAVQSHGAAQLPAGEPLRALPAVTSEEN